MTVTTVKVSTETRDRLKAQAAAAGITLGEHLARLADAGDRALRMQALQAAIASTPPSVLAEYRSESEEWLDADLTGDRAR